MTEAGDGGKRRAAPPRIAILVAFTGDGGVEHMVTRLIDGFLAQGVRVDVLLIKERGGHARRIPAAARIIRLHAATSLLAIPAVVRYLRRERPEAVLAAKDRAGRAALIARAMARVDTRVVLRLGMHLSGSLAGKSRLRRWSRWLPVRLLYPQADHVVTVADAVAEDFAIHGGLCRKRLTVIPNPSVPPDLAERLAEPAGHAWLTRRDRPVILAAGRLRPQKDFATLLMAFARLRARSALRLVILGEGPERARLEALAHDLGIADDVLMPGFIANPFPWLAAADVFVLSSAFEGAPNVLVEALACGTPVVATDCPSGPREILAGGRHGELVPVGDPAAMAEAVARTLAERPDPAALRASVSEFTVQESSRRYLALLLEPGRRNGSTGEPAQ